MITIVIGVLTTTLLFIGTVLCRPVARQRPQNKQLYNNRPLLSNGSANKGRC
jgi:hypothetical protein